MTGREDTDQTSLADLLTQLRRTSESFVDAAIDAKAAGRLSQKTDFETRGRYTRRVIKWLEARSSRNVLPKRVFMSFSKGPGSKYAKRIRLRLTKSGFEVVTGFDKSKGENVLTRVLRQLEGSSIYFGILTPENEEGAPSIWTVEEKGMALAKQLPIVLMVHERVDPDYWKKTTPERAHFVFNDRDFGERAKEAIDLAQEHFERIRERFLADGTLLID